MKFSNAFTVALLFLTQSASVLSHPSAQPLPETQLLSREQAESLDRRNVEYIDLWKRKGGGGGGGKGGGGGGSSGKGGGSSGGSSGYVSSSSSSSSGSGSSRGSGSGSGSSTSKGGSSSGAAGTTKNTPNTGLTADVGSTSSSSIIGGMAGLAAGFAAAIGGARGGGGRSSSSSHKSNSHSSSSGKGSSSSSVGGSTKTGSGVTPAYGGGRYYGGGATTPYSSGARSPLGIAPVFLAVGLLSIYPGLWLYGAYNYPYTHPYTFHNRTGRANSTNTTTTRRDTGFEVVQIRQTSDEGVNQTKPVICLCALYAECGCDDDGNSTFLDSVIGDGTYANLNQSLVTVSDVNGTSTILLNGTLPNGTTAAGGTDDAFSGAARNAIEMSGYWVMVAIVGLTVYFV